MASAQSPLISLGRLLHKGWSLQPPSSSVEAGVNLVTPDRCCEVPLRCKKNSLALHTHIRMVNMVEENFPTTLPLTSIGERDEPMIDEDDDEEMLVVQTIMEPARELTSQIFRRGWHHTEAGNPFHHHAGEHQVLRRQFAVPNSFVAKEKHPHPIAGLSMGSHRALRSLLHEGELCW